MIRNNHFHSFLIILSTLILFILINGSNENNVSAASEDYSDVISEAPDGLDISQYFDVGKFALTSGEDSASYPYQTNSATIYNNSSNASDPKNGKVLNLAKGGTTGTVGAAWSNSSNDNYIDITKKQTVSVWLYFGSGDGGDKTQNGEGMSLVLQNDDRKTSAMGAGYQGLGSMGFDQVEVKENKFPLFDWAPDNTSASLINTPAQAASTAVQKSIALNLSGQSNSLISSNILTPTSVGYTPETSTSLGTVKHRYNMYTLHSFDTMHTSYAVPSTYPGYADLKSSNTSLNYGNSGGAYGSISLSYPGNALTYKDFDLSVLSNTNFTSTDVNNPWTFINALSKGQLMTTVQAGSKSAYLVNGADANKNVLYWHHLTFTWNPAENGNPATISYAFNDKFPDGTINNGQGSGYDEVTGTIPVDTSAFGSPSNNRVYWGLTGANSMNSNTFSKLAVFESIPALATANLKTTLTDNTLGKTITDASTDKTVNNGDDLSFDYNLKWDPESRQDWKKDIVAKMNLPTSDVTINSATIVYHGKNGDTTTGGDSQSYTIDTSKMDNKTLEYTLANALGNISDSTNYTSADIIVNGTANNETNQQITVEAEPANFTSPNAIETTSTPEFLINDVSVISKSLKLKVSPTLSFKSINYKSNAQYLERNSKFDLSVTSFEDPWKLSVATNGLYDGSQAFYGNIVYKKNANSDPVTLTNASQVIESDLVSHNTTTTDDIAGNWSDDTGLLLEPDNTTVTPAGTYTGTLKWTLSDSV